MGEQTVDQCYQSFKDVNDVFISAAKRANEIAGEISKVDLKLEDLKHYKEFTNLNASEHCKASSIEQELLRERRKLKNEQQIISVINECCGASHLIEKITKCIEKVQTQTYEPRILSELFEQGIDTVWNEFKNHKL
jgi:hypothetical protein